MTTNTLPSWSNELRENEIVNRVRDDLRTKNNNILGMTINEARNLIEFGQADFAQQLHGFSAEDRVLVYAYLNQIRHLEELIEIFRQFFEKERTDRMTVIDLGCGPFTGGLAFSCVPGPSFDYIGLDRSREMRELGNRLASAAEKVEDVPKIDNILWTGELQLARKKWNTHPIGILYS